MNARRTARFQTLALITLSLSLMVVLMGAYVRLSDAGLGCPDWPGCYGRVLVPESTGLYPERPLHPGKAWREMIHRYAAGSLALLIVGLAVLAARCAELARVRPMTWGLVALVLFQALLGMWTVTMKLHPAVVMGHLMGGLTITALLFGLVIATRKRSGDAPLVPVRGGRVLLTVIVLQLLLGGWTSANYAAPFCPDFPTCQGRWWPPMDLGGALRSELPPTAQDFEGGTLSAQARTAIHVAHRIGAVITLVLASWLTMRLWRSGRRALASLLGSAAVLQFAIGVINVWMAFPLALGVAHSGGAMLLLLAGVSVVMALRPAAEGVAERSDVTQPITNLSSMSSANSRNR